MSNHLAVATVGAVLRQVVLGAVSGAVSGSVAIQFGRPPAAPTSALLVNIYLYRVSPSAALRNDDLATRDSGGRLTRRPRAAIELHYLLSFYGDPTTLEPERMLAAVIRDLHARAIVTSQLIADAVTGSGGVLDTTDLADDQPVRFGMEMLSLDDLARLWSLMVQAPHAISVAYMAAPVLLDALDRAATPLPVLRRGEDDHGVDTRIGPFPQLDSAWIGVEAALARIPRPASLRAAQFGTMLLISGSNLGGETLTLGFRHASMPPIDVAVADDDRDASQIRLALAEPALTAGDWAAGLYRVTATTAAGEASRTSAAWPLVLAPRVTGIVAAPSAGGVMLSVTCIPPVQIGQRATLRIGEREVAAQPHPAATATLEFDFAPAPVVTAELIWLLVDGTESLPFVYDAASGTFAFDPAQRVTLP